MTDSIDDGELRDLRAKAYGPGGELTDAEARRLDELQGSARRAAAESSVTAAAEPVPDRHGDGIPPQPVDAAEVRTPDGEPGTEPESGVAGPDARPQPAGLRGLLKRRWFPVAAVGVALLVGVGIGFVAFGQDIVRSIALSLSVGAEQVELEADGDYDPGSITPIGQSHGVTIWHATRQDGEDRCVVLTIGDRVERTCIPSSQFGEQGAGLYASMNLPADDAGDASGLNVSVGQDIGGDLVVIANVWTPEMWDWRSQYTEDELAIIDRIERATGIGGEGLQIVGYDDDRPIWLEYTGTGKCVIVAVVDGVERACTQHADEDVTLEIADADRGVARYHVAISSSRGPTLTIERVPAQGIDVSIDDTTEDVEP
ncbi:hypothetical protein [Microbacterium sp. NPDC056234]|uniref:hypothetical protein n=1 Tax=Microbacterium sp. NPDC056234 TaxID=3345757 RepID=UPI0035D73E55